MAVNLHRVFRCVAVRSPHQHHQHLIQHLISIVDHSIIDPVGWCRIQIKLSFFSCKNPVHNGNRLVSAHPDDSDSGTAHAVAMAAMVSELLSFSIFSSDLPALANLSITLNEKEQKAAQCLNGNSNSKSGCQVVVRPLPDTPPAISVLCSHNYLHGIFSPLRNFEPFYASVGAAASFFPAAASAFGALFSAFLFLPRLSRREP